MGMQCRFISLSTALRQVWCSQSVWGSSLPTDTTKTPLRICFEMSCFVLWASVASSTKSPRAAEGAVTQYTFPVLMYHLQWCSVPVDARPGAESRLYYEFCLAFASTEGSGAWIRCTGALEDSMTLRLWLCALWEPCPVGTDLHTQAVSVASIDPSLQKLEQWN